MYCQATLNQYSTECGPVLPYLIPLVEALGASNASGDEKGICFINEHQQAMMQYFIAKSSSTCKYLQIRILKSH